MTDEHETALRPDMTTQAEIYKASLAEITKQHDKLLEENFELFATAERLRRLLFTTYAVLVSAGVYWMVLS